MTTFIDGSRITPGTERCMCDSKVPRPDGRPRDCEFPCFQRIGLTTDPCCPDCAPLPGDEDVRT